jgi:hypothetical protein
VTNHLRPFFARLIKRAATGLLVLVLAPLSLSAQELSTAEMAAKLANPTVPLGQMSSNFDFTFYGGDLPDAGKQFSAAYTFQPTVPFNLGGPNSLFFRPAIPVLFGQPVYTGDGWDNVTGLGEISFDIAFGGTTDGGILLIAGLVGTLPTSTNDAIGAGHWAFGPEFLIGVAKDWGVIGNLFSHKWDVAGTDGTSTNLTSGQYFYAFPFGDGTTQVAAGPNWSYDHTATEGKLTLPLGIGLAKTTSLGSGIWKFAIEYWYYVASSDTFGPRHQIRAVVTPVVNLPWG